MSVDVTIHLDNDAEIKPNGGIDARWIDFTTSKGSAAIFIRSQEDKDRLIKALNGLRFE